VRLPLCVRSIVNSWFTTTMFVLNCLALDDQPRASKIFTLEILRTKNVRALRDAIKATKQNTFLHVDPEVLTLWSYGRLTFLLTRLKSFKKSSRISTVIPRRNRSLRGNWTSSSTRSDKNLHVIIVLLPTSEWNCLVTMIPLHALCRTPRA
jgi:hypothetical protein